MDNMLYLLNIGVSGIKSIKEEISLNFYKKTVDKDFNPEKYRIKAIYGENGAGKSAIITAVKIFQDLIVNDNYLNESKTQGFLNEIINKSTQNFRFHCEFLMNVETVMIVYDYSVHIGKNRNGQYEIQYESLKMKKGSYANMKYKTILESRNGELVYVNCEDDRKNIIEKKTTNLLTNHSFICLLMGSLDPKYEKLDIRYSVEKDIWLHMLICTTLAVVLKVYIGEEDQHELYFLRKRLKDNSMDKQVLVERLIDYGDSLNAFFSVNEKHVDKSVFEKYKEKVERLTQFIKIFKSDLVTIDIDAKENGEQYVCELNLNYGDYVINKEFESTGIKKLIRLFDCFVAASTGGIVFVDEMDSNLNDVYLCKLIEYFMYYGKGQLCFTTHNLDPMSVLKENRNSIDFLSSDNHLVSWTSRGNASPENCYKNGMIENSPFNIDATDFVGIFGE